MNKIGLIIKREYLTRVKKRSFIIMTFLGPILLAAIYIIPILLALRGDSEKRTIAVVDQSHWFERQFTNTETQLHTGDTIYMYTDGYSDQFGGSNCKKMKSNKIKKFLRALHDDDMEEQCLAVQELFTQWKGDNPQTDDVLFIGLKI